MSLFSFGKIFCDRAADGGGKLLLIGVGLQALRFFIIGEEAALDQDAGAFDVLHQIDGLRRLALPVIRGVHILPKGLLDALRKRLAAVCLCKEHLRAAILGLLAVILMDADQQAVFHRVHHGSAVFQVGDLFLRNGPAIAGIDRRIRIADHLRIDAHKRKQVAQPQRDFQIDPAFQNAVRRRCAAVLAAVSGVQNDGPAARSGSVYSGRPASSAAARMR